MSALVWPRRCRRCGESDVDKLVTKTSAPGGVDTMCKPCDRAARKARYRRNPGATHAAVKRWVAANPAKAAEYGRRNRLRKAGVAYEDNHYQRLLEEQGGACAICGADGGHRGLRVDHDHTTGVVRGALCDRCNRGLGFFGDSPEVLAAAAAYLSREALTGVY